MQSDRHIFRSVVAFFIALLGAAVALALGVIASDTDADPVERVRFFAAEFFASGLGPAVALLLALAAIALGAAGRIRTILYYVVAGALVGLASSYSVDLSDALENTTDVPPVSFPLTLGAVAGLIGGLVFWAVAGRHFTKRPN
jgi:hypothetical protein